MALENEIISDELDYKSPINLWDAKELLAEIEWDIPENKKLFLSKVEATLLLKTKAIYDIKDIEWLSWKFIVLWFVGDNYFISLTSNLWLYNKEYDFKFKWESKVDVIDKLNEELEKYNFEVPVESDDWR